MISENDHPQQWRNYLNNGRRHFSEQLFTPGIALIVSPDGRKMVVIGEDTQQTRFDYDEKENLSYINYCNGGLGTFFNCPACEQPYIISLEKREQVGKEPISILKGTSFFECACEVLFTFYDRYEFLHLPFEINELAPLYLAGMSRTADLFVRYTLSSSNYTLVEEVGVVSQMPNAISLTESPSFKFSNWCNPPEPSFVIETRGGSFLAYDVQIWRIRTYTLESEMFEEKTRPSYVGGAWKRVLREIRSLPDDYTNQKMLDSLAAANNSFSSNSHNGNQLQESRKRRPGRPKGTGWFRDKAEFQRALKEVLQSFHKRRSQLHVLVKLDGHSLCRIKPKKIRTQSDTKLLRIWIEQAGLRDFDHVIEMFWDPSK
jgi:hypothetical protein